MIVYCDTSVLLSGWLNEADSEQVRRWFERQAQATLAISDWTATELHGALSRKVRSGELAEAARNRLVTAISAALRDGYLSFAVERQDFNEAARLLDDHRTGLRAADALHLAIARNRGVKLATLDLRLGAVAEAHVAVDRVLPPN